MGQRVQARLTGHPALHVVSVLMVTLVIQCPAIVQTGVKQAGPATDVTHVSYLE